MNSDNQNEEVQVFEDEKKILLDRDYDGIKELDHPLPRWWVITFVLTVVFAVPYYFAHTFFGAQTIQEELAADMKQIHEIQANYELKQGKFDLTNYQNITAEAKSAQIGKESYQKNCTACHGAKGEGGVGPNLADAYWIHGDGSLAAVYNAINKGTPEKGMPAWGPILGKEKMYSVLNYVSKFKGKNPAGAKEPQGKKYP